MPASPGEGSRRFEKSTRNRSSGRPMPCHASHSVEVNRSRTWLSTRSAIETDTPSRASPVRAVRRRSCARGNKRLLSR
jgi:hypothetical protein